MVTLKKPSIGFLVMSMLWATASSQIAAQAGDFSVALDYGCLGIDGVPIPKYTNLAAQCCGNGASQNEICRVGFHSMVPDAMNDANNINYAAQQLLYQAAHHMSGNKGDLDSGGNPDDSDPGPPSTSSGVVSSGMTAVGGSPKTAGILTSGSGPANLARSGGSGSSGTSGASPGAVGLGSDWSKSLGSPKILASVGSASSEAGGSYTSNGAQKREGHPGAGASGVSSSAGEGSIEFGNGASIGNASGSVAGSEDALEGSKEDAPDYLSRIHKKDSIFKIISRRYQKEVARNRLSAIGSSSRNPK